MKYLFALLGLAFNTSIYSFTLNNNLNLSFEQNEVNVYVASNLCDNIGLSEADLVNLVGEANANYWNTVSSSRLVLKSGGLVNISTDYGSEPLCTGAGSSCEVNPLLAYASGILVACNDDTTVNFPNSGLLAVTVPTSFSGNKIKGAVLLLNDTNTNAIASKTRDEIRALLAHELGHAIGLGHSPVRDSLMYYLSIPTRRKLGWDDIDGITYLYPKEEPVSCGTTVINDENQNNKGQLIIGLALGFLTILFGFKFYRRWSSRLEGIFSNQ